MRYRILVGLVITLLAGLGALAAGTAAANPTGLFVDSESCSGGTVRAMLHWTPDSAGQQFVDLSTRNDNFTVSYSTAGPYSTAVRQEELAQLKPNTVYYLRVSTLIGTDFLRSSTLAYTTRSCSGSSGGGSSGGTARPPTNLQAAAFSATQARFQWTPGSGNRYFCLDYAKSINDLLNRGGSWRNSGCGTTSNSHVVNVLACGTTYYARVWTPAGGGLYSPVRSVTTYSCASAISAPVNLTVVFTTKTTARLDWDPGKDNRWFCVDTAKSQADLVGLTGTWRNHSCWTTASQVTIGGLSCETLYFWRVYTWNRITNAHSGISSFRTDDCDTSQVRAPIEDVDVDKVGAEYRATIVVGKPNTCHSFGAYESSISGNVIRITVYNTVAEGACAEVYSTYDLVINLGSGFFTGVTYTVVVNDDESDSFTAN
jgi:hypothetical protein